MTSDWMLTFFFGFHLDSKIKFKTKIYGTPSVPIFFHPINAMTFFLHFALNVEFQKKENLRRKV